MSDSTKSEREKFEAWIATLTDWRAVTEARLQKTVVGKEIVYTDSNIQSRWITWQAARSESAPADLRRAWEQGRTAACSAITENRYYRVVQNLRDAGDNIRALINPYPGESAHATHDNLSCAVCGKGMELVSGDPRAFYKCSSCGSDPELTAGEAGSPAPAPTEVKCPWCSFPTTLTGNVSPEDMICRRCHHEWKAYPLAAPAGKEGNNG